MSNPHVKLREQQNFILNQALQAMLQYLDEYEDAIGDEEEDYSLERLAQASLSLPDDTPDMYSLLCTMGTVLASLRPVVFQLYELDLLQQKSLQRSRELRKPDRLIDTRMPYLMSDQGLCRDIKKGFFGFAHCWFHEFTQQLRPNWSPSTIAIVNTQQQPALLHLGYSKMLSNLLGSLARARSFLHNQHGLASALQDDESVFRSKDNVFSSGRL